MWISDITRLSVFIIPSLFIWGGKRETEVIRNLLLYKGNEFLEMIRGEKESY
jgi:hypothetical protein